MSTVMVGWLLLFLCGKCLPWEIVEEEEGNWEASTAPLFPFSPLIFLLEPQEHSQQPPIPTFCLFWSLFVLLLLLLVVRLLVLPSPLGGIWRWPGSINLLLLQEGLAMLLYFFVTLVVILMHLFQHGKCIPNVLLATRSFTISHFILLLYGKSWVMATSAEWSCCYVLPAYNHFLSSYLFYFDILQKSTYTTMITCLSWHLLCVIKLSTF